MHSASRRLLSTAGVALLAASVASCSDSGDEQPEQSTSTSAAPTGATGPTGCDGPSSPKFSGTDQAFDSVARVDQNRAVGVRADAPSLTKAASGARGWAVAQVDVSAAVVTNGIFAVTPDSFVLVDPRGSTCTRPRVNPGGTPLAVSEIDEKKSAKGAVSFLVPSGADLSKYTVLYTAEPGDASAQVRWAAGGAKPSAPANANCSNTPSPMSVRDKASREKYGEPETIGDTSVGSRVTVAKPKAKTLKPSDRHPNDVDGLEVKVKVEALGTATFVDRKMFQLIDGSGHLCRFSELGTEGENLTSDVVAPGKSKAYTLIFWVRKGSAESVKGTQVFFRPDTSGTAAEAVWFDPKEKAPYPTPTPRSSTSAPKSSGSSGSASTSAPSGSSGRPTPSSSAATSTPTG